MWYVVNSLDAIHAGPLEWSRDAISASLAELSVNVRVTLLEPVSPLSITDLTTSEVAHVLPQNSIVPTLEAWEELAVPVEVVVPDLEVTATYGKQDRTKQDVYNERIAELFALRVTKLESGVEDPAELGTFFRLDAAEVAKVALVAANIGTAKYTVDADVAAFSVWKTNGDFRSLPTLPEVKNTAKKLGDRIMDLDDVTRIHRNNLVQLLNDTTSWLGGYLGPGHGVPFTSQDLAEYDITVYWP